MRNSKSRLSLLGPYTSYKDALSHSSGYDDPIILQKVYNAVSCVLSGEFAYERDGTTFATIPNPLVIRSVLKNCLQCHSSIVDFGGGLGSLFASNPDIFVKSNNLTVVEQSKWVEVGIRLYKDIDLDVNFISSLAELDFRPSFLILSSVLMYVPDAESILVQVSKLRPDHIIIDRTAFSRLIKHEWFVQNEPVYYGKPVSYPFKPVNRQTLLTVLSEYRIVKQWKNDFDVDYPPHSGMHLVLPHSL